MSDLKFFTVKELNERLEKAASENRHDIVAGTMNDIFAKKAAKNSNEIVTSVDFSNLYSSIANMNKSSNFKEYFKDVFETSVSTQRLNDTVGATSRLAGYEEDFRPSPTEISSSNTEKIKTSSFEVIKYAISNAVDNPQYHFNDFVTVAQYGENSGIASWTVAFNTGKGIAKINIPMAVVDGVIENPKVFYASTKDPIELNTDNLKKFAQTYSPNFKKASTISSGVDTLGGTTIISEKQNIGESIEQQLITNFGGGTMISEDKGVQASSFDKQKLISAIDVARKFITTKLGDVNLDLKYSAGMETDDAAMLVAFTLSRNTANGLKTATIPVEVRGLKCVGEAFYDGQQQSHALENTVIKEYFSAPAADLSVQEVEAFADSFLATDASYKQLQEELKYAVLTNKISRAKSVLFAIANRFGDETLENAMNDFSVWSLEAKEIKSGKKPLPKEFAERESAFSGTLKTSSIVFN